MGLFKQIKNILLFASLPGACLKGYYSWLHMYVSLRMFVTSFKIRSVFS